MCEAIRFRRRLRSSASFAVWLVVVAIANPAAAQPRSAAVADPDPGVRPTRLIDREEIRVSRIDLQPGAVRSAHAHDDVAYHVWAPVSGTLEITIGDAPPVRATSGQAMFMTRGTRHGFRNVGDGPAAVFEIFVKLATVRADLDAAIGDLLAALAPVPVKSGRESSR